MSRTPSEEQCRARNVVGYGAIWLIKIGDHTIVRVEKSPGIWVDVIKELTDSNFSHIIEPLGIESAFLHKETINA